MLRFGSSEHFTPGFHHPVMMSQLALLKISSNNYNSVTRQDIKNWLTAISIDSNVVPYEKIEIFMSNTI